MRGLLRGLGPLIAPVLILVAMLMVLGALRRGVASLDELNTDTAAAMTLILVATGETIVILRGGIDLSVGGVLSLTTAILATRGGVSDAAFAGWTGLMLALGGGIGLLNGLLIAALELQPFLVTLATWSVVGGIALIVLPTEGGKVPDYWVTAGAGTLGGLSLAVWGMAALLVWWVWFRRTRLAANLRAAGSSERSAFLCGVPLGRMQVAAYGFSGLFAALAGVFLTTQTGSGSPTVGNDFVLPAVAAVVIGGTSLFGGRGGLVGTVLGAFILTVIGNVVFVLHISSYWQPVAAGTILVGSVLATSLGEREAARRRLSA
jgi:ribose transport system permease protein